MPNAWRIREVKSLFDPALVKDTEQRISRLSPASRPQWGSMGLVQTLAHCTSAIEMAMGVLHARRAPFPASLIGRLIKPLVFRDDKPMRRNSPSSPELFSGKPTQDDLERERSRLLDAIRTFASQGPAGCTRNPHPFFGPLEPQQWAILMYKHVDHHLRQFAA